ncbi:conserved hypothetical protein [Desulfamplus magnetovallimortis]|uniref:Addiction module toxin RelE n=1 Tax=Desulfamplus magnetovallimortis TaxID=1246637 RepID=A0A1W1H7N4_9BACT|nr:type II toxin-antitoxin system RelE/ParE family toxin [Desulfamplus magnetovallimortis]SLM28491.1 conserved hypothetical protein [Desulfamplus magnetovallimortis]
MTWEILFSEEYESWFKKLPQRHKVAIATDLEVLRDIGPMLGRPHVDQIKGSKFKNLKELRTKVPGHVYRSLFAFDPERKAIMLSGGDKKGKNQDQFYKQLIAQAEVVFENHIKSLQNK